MYYEFLKLTLIVKILKLENILCEKELFTTLNREPFIPMPFLFWKLSYFTFKYDKYLLFHEKKKQIIFAFRRDVKSSVQ